MTLCILCLDDYPADGWNGPRARRSPPLFLS